MHFNEGVQCPQTNGIDWMVIYCSKAWPLGKEILQNLLCLPNFFSPPKSCHSSPPPAVSGENSSETLPPAPRDAPSPQRAGGGRACVYRVSGGSLRPPHGKVNALSGNKTDAT